MVDQQTQVTVEEEWDIKFGTRHLVRAKIVLQNLKEASFGVIIYPCIYVYPYVCERQRERESKGSFSIKNYHGSVQFL